MTSDPPTAPEGAPAEDDGALVRPSDDQPAPAPAQALAAAPTASPSGAAPLRPLQAGAAPVIGLVLGAGAARGWSHIGVLQALEARGLKPSIVVGCSSGAVVGAAYASGRLGELTSLVESLTWRGVLSYFDFSWRGGGLIEGRWLVDFFRDSLGDQRIEDLPITFGSVATELSSGRETWFTSGSLVDAVRASIALPGLVTPIAIEGRWMVDGALVNPVPVSLCRALGAQIIIGVSMSGDLVTLGRSPLALPAKADPGAAPEELPDVARQRAIAAMEADLEQADLEAAARSASAARLASRGAPTGAAEQRSSWLAWLTGYGGGGWARYWAGANAASQHPGSAPAPPPAPQGRPGYFDVIGQSFFNVQNFVSRIRLAADPVDLLIVPDVEGLGIMDFHRGVEAIEAGRAAVAAVEDRIEALRAERIAPQDAAFS
ncbi:MAG: patatin-like phospholipase family protein [Pseudomonadota bacterium]